MNPPPMVNQFAKDARTPDTPGIPMMITAMPPTIIARTAAILIIANQNSNSPNFETPIRFIAVISTRKNAADTHCGIAGNQ